MHLELVLSDRSGGDLVLKQDAHPRPLQSVGEAPGKRRDAASRPFCSLPVMVGMPRQWWRLGGVAAIAFVVVFVVGVALQSAPPSWMTPSTRSGAIGSRAANSTSSPATCSLGFVFFYIPFMLVLRSLLGRVEGGIELWSRAALVGAFTTLLWGIWSGMFWGALAFGDFAATASDETLRTLSVLDYYAVSGTPLAFAVLVGASSIVIARTRVLWRWLAYLGAVEVVLSLLAPFYILSTETDSVFDLTYPVAFLGFALWILLVGIAMVARTEEPAPPSAQA